jgi:hypothetical protein
MKRLLTTFSLVASLALPAAAQTHDHKQKHEHKHDAHHAPAPAEQTANVALKDGEVVRRGAALGTSETVKFADVLKEPQKYAGKTIIVEGVVERVCQKQGCWMELAPEKGSRGVRVAFKDHAFFVPFNSAGLKARAEGVFSVKSVTSEEADHLEKEGARTLSRDKDGEASEVLFTATGLELRK